MWPSADLFAPGIALGYMVGRLGCLMAGCCYGKPTDVAWAVTFTDPAANLNVGTPLNVALHPTQLYEAGAGFVILIALLLLEKRPGHFAGRTFWSFAFLYAVLRFVIEFYRGDDRGMVLNTLSTSRGVMTDRKARGLGVLFITHDLSLGHYISDRTMILRKGVVVELGPTEKVFGNPQHGYTKLLLDSVPQLHTKWNGDAPRQTLAEAEPPEGTPTLVEVEPGHFAAI